MATMLAFVRVPPQRNRFPFAVFIAAVLEGVDQRFRLRLPYFQSLSQHFQRLLQCIPAGLLDIVIGRKLSRRLQPLLDDVTKAPLSVVRPEVAPSRKPLACMSPAAQIRSPTRWNPNIE